MYWQRFSPGENTSVADSNGKVNVETEQGNNLLRAYFNQNYSGVVEAQNNGFKLCYYGTVTEFFVEEGQEAMQRTIANKKVDAFTAQMLIRRLRQNNKQAEDAGQQQIKTDENSRNKNG